MPKLLKPIRRADPAGNVASIREVCLIEARPGRSATLGIGTRIRRGGRDYRVTTVHHSGSGRSYVHLASVGIPVGP